MSVANKVRAMLNITGKKPSDFADCLGISVQAVRNKFSRDSLSISDIIKIADALGWELQCKAPDGQSITLTIDDIKKPAANCEK